MCNLRRYQDDQNYTVFSYLLKHASTRVNHIRKSRSLKLFWVLCCCNVSAWVVVYRKTSKKSFVTKKEDVHVKRYDTSTIASRFVANRQCNYVHDK